MEIDEPTEIGTKCTYTQIDTNRDDVGRSHIGRETELGPRIFTLNPRTIQQTESEFSICWQSIFRTKVEGSTQHSGTSTLIAIVLQLIEVAQVVKQTVAFVLKAVRCLVIEVEDILVGCESLFAIRGSHHVVVPPDETQIEQRSRETPVVIELVFRTEVDGQAESVQAKLVVVQIVHVGVAVLLSFRSTHLRLRLVGKVLHTCLHLRIRHGSPFVLAQRQLCLLELGIHIACTQQELQFSTHTQILVDVTRMTKGQFGVCLAMRIKIADVIRLVLDSLLGQPKQRSRQIHIHICTGIHTHRVVTTESLESDTQHLHIHVGANSVLVFDIAQELVGTHCWIEERGRLAIHIVKHILHGQVATKGNIHITNAWHRHIALLVAGSRIHLMSKEVAIREISRIGVLRIRGESSTQSSHQNCLYFFILIEKHRTSLFIIRHRNTPTPSPSCLSASPSSSEKAVRHRGLSHEP